MKPYYEEDGITIYHGDCREVLPLLGLMIGCFLLADPPYGAGLSFDYNERFSPANEKWWKNSDRSSGIRHATVVDDDKPFDPAHLMGHPRIVLWGANHYASRLQDSGGWLVWDKRNGDRDVSGCEWPMSECELAWTNLSNGVRIFRHRAQIMAYWPEEITAEIEERFEIGERGTGWAYLHPKSTETPNA